MRDPQVPEAIRDLLGAPAAEWLREELRALWTATSAKRGVFVAIEGIDASGKATLARHLGVDLARWFRCPHSVVEVPRYDCATGRALRAHLRREWHAATPPMADGGRLPTDVERSDPRAVRAKLDEFDALAFQALMTFNRYEVAPAIRAKLAAGEVVIADRWWGSSWAYGSVEGVDAASIVAASASLPQPDAWVLLDLPASVACARRAARDRNEGDAAKLERVREAYLRVAAERGWVVIDATQRAEDVAHGAYVAVMRQLVTATRLDLPHHVTRLDLSHHEH